MIARGSFRYCVEACASAFHVQHYDRLAILCNAAGKYYSIATEEDLSKLGGPAPNLGPHRLVFYGTERELLTIARPNQLDIFPEVTRDASPETV